MTLAMVSPRTASLRARDSADPDDSQGQAGLIARARAGDEDARQALAQECRQSAYPFALQLLGNRQARKNVAARAATGEYVRRSVRHLFRHRETLLDVQDSVLVGSIKPTEHG